MAVPDLESFAARGQALIGQPVRAVVVNHPGDAAARVGIYGWNSDANADKRLSPNTGMAMFSAASGEPAAACACPARPRAAARRSRNR